MTQRYLGGASAAVLEPVAGKGEILAMQEEVRSVRIAEHVARYIVGITNRTRSDLRLTLGASPRATLALARTSQACAYLEGRDFVLPDDVQKMAPCVLCHRLVLSPEAKIKNVKTDEILKEIIGEIPVPVLP